jgi:steroid 5-alpha reductase family enzyme
MTGSASGRGRGLLVCTTAYLAAAAAAVFVGRLMAGAHPLFIILAADVAATAVVFLFSLGTDNSSMYDPYWSVVPPVIALYWAIQPEAIADPERQVIVGGLVLAWAVRLTFNWVRRWEGLGWEDWRYVDFRSQWGRLYWPGSFFGIHLVPTLIVYLSCLPLWPAMAAGGRPLGALDLLAAIVTGGAIWLETMADRQLHRFLRTPGRRGTLATGVWARSRHPNYLGEVLFWWGLWLFGVAADPSFWWTVVGPVVMTALFVFISIPMMDKRMLARRPDYAEHCRQIPALWPRIRRAPVD